MIHVIATVELHDGQREAFLAEFHKIVPDVHKEEGCLEYGPTVDAATDIGAQIPFRANVVTIVEKWGSLEHLRQHSNAPHMKAYRPKVKDLVVKTTLMILTPA